MMPDCPLTDVPMLDPENVVDTSSRLLALPPELQKRITDVLDFPSKLVLRITSRGCSFLVEPPTHQDLLVAEQSTWAKRRGLYACMDCCRLRADRKFADAMMKGPKGRNGKEPHKRFCIDCGLHPKPRATRYSPGAELVVEGRRYVVCKSCRQYTAEVGCVGSGQCGGCHSLSGCHCGSASSFMTLRSESPPRRSRRSEYEGFFDHDNSSDEYGELQKSITDMIRRIEVSSMARQARQVICLEPTAIEAVMIFLKIYHHL